MSGKDMNMAGDFVILKITNKMSKRTWDMAGYKVIYRWKCLKGHGTVQVLWCTNEGKLIKVT